MHSSKTVGGGLRLLAVAAVVFAVAAPVAHAQTPAEIQAALDAAHAKYQTLEEGKNADYIPALAKVDSNIYGIALVTTDGKVYTTGDIKSEVSIQSISKVFTMSKVIQDSGPDAIANTIGTDATGMRFNSIVSIEFSEKVLGGPEMNALVNPGAIAATSMVKGASRDEIWQSLLSYYSDFAGRPLSVNQEVFKSESDTNQRNQAIGYLMYAYGYIKAEPMRATDIYTEQCSVSVNAKDLATMAGTLANGGKNPVTGKQVLKAEYVPKVLAVMATAGLYDDSGKWLFRTGLPGKERRRRRHRRRLPRQVRDRGHLAAPRRGGQHRPRPEGDRRHLERPRWEPLRRDAAVDVPDPPRAASLARARGASRGPCRPSGYTPSEHVRGRSLAVAH